MPPGRAKPVTAGVVAAVVAVLACVLVSAPSRAAASPTGSAVHDHRLHVGWPASGEAAYVIGNAHVIAGPGQRVVPIASVAKMMTAYLVLQSFPLLSGRNGFRFTVTEHDVADTAIRRSQDQSLVPVVAGEQLTERQALAALLLPSANNIAIMLARRVGGSVAAFVRRMNRTARALHMTRTTYTDPSGFLASTRSTAADQVRLALAAMQIPAFARMVAERVHRIPVAGLIYNTDTLLGHDGFSGIKTGSDSAAGGCFAFRSLHRVDGRALRITGVVLGLYGPDLISAGLDASRLLVDDIVSQERR